MSRSRGNHGPWSPSPRPLLHWPYSRRQETPASVDELDTARRARPDARAGLRRDQPGVGPAWCDLHAGGDQRGGRRARRRPVPGTAGRASTTPPTPTRCGSSPAATSRLLDETGLAPVRPGHCRPRGRFDAVPPHPGTTACVVGTVNLYAASRPVPSPVCARMLATIFGAWAPGAITNADLSFSTRDTAREAPQTLRDRRLGSIGPSLMLVGCRRPDGLGCPGLVARGRTEGGHHRGAPGRDVVPERARP